MTKNATHIFAENPATGNMKRVRFIRWFDRERLYARVEFQNGRKLSVPTKLLIKI